MEWRSEPRRWQALPEGIQLTTDGGTDFWRHTHYGFVRDNGHFRFDTVHRDFELEVTIAGDYQEQYDQPASWSGPTTNTGSSAASN
jgi:regulation of enolase protein 1 (concanavalin A-like superfamily)